MNTTITQENNKILQYFLLNYQDQEVTDIKATYIHTDETGQQRLIEQNTSQKDLNYWNKDNNEIIKLEYIPLEDVLDGKFECGLITSNVEVT